MFTANFYVFSKRPNSTKLPSDGAVPMQVELKDATDIINPALKVSGATGITTPYLFNYCYVPTFNRYYFIESWRYESAIWTCYMRVDVLGSYRNEIRNSEQYVLRSASASNGRVLDRLYPTINERSTAQYAVSTGRSMTYRLQKGYYVLGVISEDSSEGCVNYLILNNSQMDTLKDALFSDVSFYGVSDISSQLLKTLFNPYDYIVSCKWFPITNLPTAVGAETFPDAIIGWWGFSGADVYKLGANTLSVLTNSWYIPPAKFGAHPQSGRGIYLNYAPYSDYTLNIAPYGCINIPSEAAEKGLYCNEWIDLITGECILKLFIGGTAATATVVPLLTIESMLAIDIQLAQVRPDGGLSKAGMISQGINLVTSMITDGDGPLTSALSGITGAINAQNTTLQTSGSNGGYSRLAQFGDFDATVTCKYQLIADEDNAHLGRPLCAVRTLSTLSGYTLCSSATIQTAGTAAENGQIIDYLNSGVYLE